MTDSHRIIESVIDEAAVWQGTQKISQVLALFRDRYTPKAGSPIIDTGDPADNDAQGRRVDIGAIDLAGHDQDRLGKFGTPPQATGGTGAGGQSGASAGGPSNGGSSAGGTNNGGAAAGATSSGSGQSNKGSCDCSVPGANCTHGSGILISLCAMLGMALLRGRRRHRFSR